MAKKINVLLPVYNERVKVSTWSFVNQAYPYDNSLTKNKGASHYKSFGQTNDVYIPKSSAREAMEIGAQRINKSKTSRRALVNFRTFPLVNDLVGNSDEYELDHKIYKLNVHNNHNLISTYAKDYYTDVLPKRKNCCDTAETHPLFNRIPQNEFLIANKSAPDKFMDTHLYEIPPNRKCINYFRQIRGTSNIFS